MSAGAPLPRSAASAAVVPAAAVNPPPSTAVPKRTTTTTTTTAITADNSSTFNDNKSNNENTYSSAASESMATMTTTRRQLQDNVHTHSLHDGGISSSSSSNRRASGVPRSSGTTNIAQLPLLNGSGNNSTRSNNWTTSGSTGSARSSASSLIEAGANSWSNSWSALQNIATSVLGADSSDEVLEEERKRRIRIAEKRRRAGLDSIVGAGAGRTSSSSAATAASAGVLGGGDAASVRSRISNSTTDGGDNSDLRPRGRRKASSSSLNVPHHQQHNEPTPPSSISSAYSRKLHKRSMSPDIAATGTASGGNASATTTTTQRYKPPRAISSPPTCGDAFTLAYIHKVRKTDTLEGVVIAYNIQPSALRRANRLWMGDSIQVRKELLLPVDECLVKGKPVEEGVASSSALQDGKKQVARGEGEAEGDGEGERVAVGEKNHYMVHSTVEISGIGVVQIARLPRKEMSHFPPRRMNTTSGHRSKNRHGDDAGGGGDVDGEGNSVFASSSRKVAHAYNPSNTGGEIPTFGQMFTQVAKETREGVGSGVRVVEGFVRRIVVKVGELAREEEGDEGGFQERRRGGIELAERRRREGSLRSAGSVGSRSSVSSRNGSVRTGAARRGGIPAAEAYEGRPLLREEGRS